MSHIIFEKQRIELDDEQTVLSALLDQGYEIPHSCRSGVCQTCLMQAVEGEVPPAAQQGLKDTLKAQAYFLACSCKPQTPLHVVASRADMLRSTATIIDRSLLCKDVLRLRLKPEQEFEYRAGQYITVWKSDSVGRSYSLASVATLDDYLELHIRRITGGVVSNWLHDDIQAGDSLQLQAATGDCFYMPGSPEQPILLAGTGTGLAPLFGIARDALQQGHSGDIHLLHGVKQADDLYLHQSLLNMVEQHSSFHYHASVLQVDADQLQAPISQISPISPVPLDQQVMSVTNDLADSKIYLCGDPGIVNSLKKKLFLAGASMSNIYTDPFLSSNDA